jgi:hypothetical protein
MRWAWIGVKATCEAAPNLSAEVRFDGLPPNRSCTLMARDSGYAVGSEACEDFETAQRMAQVWLDRYGALLVKHPTKDSPGARSRR